MNHGEPAFAEPDAPLILSLAMDPRSQRFFNEQRLRYFPPERNLIAAHLTLFHHLPGAELARILKDLRAVTTVYAPFQLDVTGLRSLGGGVAYQVHAPTLDEVHRRLARCWDAWLTPQDRQGFRPHVVVQNKVTRDAARATLHELDAGFQPFFATAQALDLAYYRGGPWESCATVPFAAQPR